MDDQSVNAVFRNGSIELDSPVEWSDGTLLTVTPLLSPSAACDGATHVIVVGFGLAGRCVADLLDRSQVSYCIIEKNPATVSTQSALGRNIVQGCATEGTVLSAAGLNRADILALTIPDEDAVLKATALARRLNPQIYILARTNYSSKGMKASQLGADEVVKGEQAVALQFYDRLSRQLQRVPQAEA